MGTKTIDIIQSNKIAALEADVLELRTALNLLVTDVLAISGKLNTLIGDQNNMNEVIMAGYTTPGSPESYGILEGIDVYKDDITEHKSRNIQLPPYVQWDRQLVNGTYLYPWYPPSGLNSYYYYDQWTAHPEEWHDPEPPAGRVSGAGFPVGNDWTAGDPVVGGTGQGGNTAASTDEVNAAVVGLYSITTGESLLSIKLSSANRARKLARKTLNRLRK